MQKNLPNCNVIFGKFFGSLGSRAGQPGGAPNAAWETDVNRAKTTGYFSRKQDTLARPRSGGTTLRGNFITKGFKASVRNAYTPRIAFRSAEL